MSSQSELLPTQCQPAAGRYAYRYTVQLLNSGEAPMRLQRKSWQLLELSGGGQSHLGACGWLHGMRRRTACTIPMWGQPHSGTAWQQTCARGRLAPSPCGASLTVARRGSKHAQEDGLHRPHVGPASPWHGVAAAVAAATHLLGGALQGPSAPGSAPACWESCPSSSPGTAWNTGRPSHWTASWCV